MPTWDISLSRIILSSVIVELILADFTTYQISASPVTSAVIITALVMLVGVASGALLVVPVPSVSNNVAMDAEVVKSAPSTTSTSPLAHAVLATDVA